MKYLCMIYGSAERWDSLTEDEREAVYDRYRSFSDELGEAGKLVAGAELQPARTATTVRVRDLETQVADGPYAETREQLGGYFVLECESMDEAVAIATRIPGAEDGSVEVRPEYVEAPA